MGNIRNSLGNFQNCEELRMFGKYSGVAEGSMLNAYGLLCNVVV